MSGRTLVGVGGRRFWMFNFAPQWRDPACAGDFGLALRRSVSVNLAELWRASPSVTPNPLRGGASSFAKASQDMSKGFRGVG